MPGTTSARSDQTADMKSAQTFSHVIGSITWLATMSPEHNEKPIAWLEKTVFPALLLKQFKLYRWGAPRYGPRSRPVCGGMHLSCRTSRTTNPANCDACT